MPKLTLIRGLPGSGKSTLAKQRLQSGELHYEADTYHMIDGEYRYDISKAAEAHAWCLRMATEGIQAGHNVVVSNTFTTMKEMQPYLDMAAKTGASLKVIHCTDQFGTIHGVPDEVIAKMKARWEPYGVEEIFFTASLKKC